MRAIDFITEGASSVLFHYCSVHSAAKILEDGGFKPSSITGNKSEEAYAPAGYPYFLSTARNKSGDYARMPGDSAVMFNLDGNWLGSRYPVKPVDYWERAWLNNPTRTSESEDRVFSKKSFIPGDCITAMHVLIQEGTKWTRPMVRNMLIKAKKLGIATFVYSDKAAWALQDTRKSISPGAASIKGQMPVKPMYRPAQSYLEQWLELIYKRKLSELSPRAEELRYNLVYYGARYPAEDQGLGNDMSGARKPNESDYPVAVKINEIMRKNGFKTTVELKNAMVAKWTEITDADREARKAARAASVT